LLVQMLGSNPHPWFHQLGQPLGTMTAAIDARSRTGNGEVLVRFSHCTSGEDAVHEHSR